MAQKIANHESAHTTGLYDRRNDQASFDEVKRRDFSEQNERLAEAIVAFEETSQRLYESAGSMTVDETSNGPIFKFPMQGQRSKGIKNTDFLFRHDADALVRQASDRAAFPYS